MLIQWPRYQYTVPLHRIDMDTLAILISWSNGQICSKGNGNVSLPMPLLSSQSHHCHINQAHTAPHISSQSTTIHFVWCSADILGMGSDISKQIPSIFSLRSFVTKSYIYIEIHDKISQVISFVKVARTCWGLFDFGTCHWAACVNYHQYNNDPYCHHFGRPS